MINFKSRFHAASNEYILSTINNKKEKFEIEHEQKFSKTNIEETSTGTPVKKNKTLIIGEIPRQIKPVEINKNNAPKQVILVDEEGKKHIYTKSQDNNSEVLKNYKKTPGTGEIIDFKA